MNQALRYTIGLPFFIARKTIANPLCWIDELFASGKPTRKPIKLEMEVDDFLDNTEEKTRIEQEIKQRLIDDALTPQVQSQLDLYSFTEIVLVLKGAHEHPALQLKLHVFTEPVKMAWSSLVGFQADVHAQGDSASEKNPCVVLRIERSKAQPTLAAIS